MMYNHHSNSGQYGQEQGQSQGQGQGVGHPSSSSPYPWQQQPHGGYNSSNLNYGGSYNQSQSHYSSSSQSSYHHSPNPQYHAPTYDNANPSYQSSYPSNPPPQPQSNYPVNNQYNLNTAPSLPPRHDAYPSTGQWGSNDNYAPNHQSWNPSSTPSATHNQYNAPASSSSWNNNPQSAHGYGHSQPNSYNSNANSSGYNVGPSYSTNAPNVFSGHPPPPVPDPPSNGYSSVSHPQQPHNSHNSPPPHTAQHSYLSPYPNSRPNPSSPQNYAKTPVRPVSFSGYNNIPPYQTVDYGLENSDVLKHGKEMDEGVGLPPKPKRHPALEGRMEPWLQLMCGPLLSYYTVENGVWHGAALVVTFDSGSDYSRPPTLSLTSNPSKFTVGRGTTGPPTQNAQSWQIQGHELYKYYGPQGPSTFWRFWINIRMESHEQSVRYRLNGGGEMQFLVPAQGMNLRWAAHSCNGFSAGTEVDDFKAERFESGFDPLWEDLLEKHDQIGYHAIVGGGDQLYCDSIVREPELQEWVNEMNASVKLQMPLTSSIKYAVDRYYFSHYCKMWRGGAFGRTNCSIPMMNMLDDHDLIDGFGSYDDETMLSPIFRHIGSRGYFWYLLFQVFTNDEVDGTNRQPGSHPIKSMVICSPGAFIPFPNHSQISYMGPNVALCMLDCRAERKIDLVCAESTYNQIFSLLERLPQEVEHLVLLLGVPIVYPRMSFAENLLSSQLNPVNWLAKASANNLGGFSNKFDAKPELLDDLADHWCAKPHKKERNDLILRLQDLALRRKIRVTLLSGDVHMAAMGQLLTWHHKESHRTPTEKDHRSMLAVVSSAIVNTSPPPAVMAMSNQFASHKHRTLHTHNTDEIQLPIFETDTDGSSRGRNKYVMNRRNYATFQVDQGHNLSIDICVEVAQGEGTTKPYNTIAPPPRW